MFELKLRRVGDALCTEWPKEALAHMKVGEGDTLWAVETPYGFMITAIDPKTVEILEEVFRRNEKGYRELAKK